MIHLQTIREAQDRITNYIRHTPIMEATSIRQPICQAQNLYLKLECLQVTGSFKARGAVNKLLSLSPEQLERGLVTASGGNHGLGVAYAGWLAHIPVTVYLPLSTSQTKAQMLRNWGATVLFKGDGWDEANQAALQVAEQQGLTYVHPFADPLVIAGQGTIGLEILEAVPNLDRLLVAIGGGGLISGISCAVREIKPDIKIIGVEPVGAPTLYKSVQAGKLVELSHITTTAGTLAPRRSAEINLEIVQQYVDEIVLVTDEEMLDAALWLWSEMGIATELSGAATVAALLTGKVVPEPSERVCALVCGAGDAAIRHA